MKVLLLPSNIASDMSHKVKALRSRGIDARGLCLGGHQIQTGDGLTTYSQNRDDLVRSAFNRISFYKRMWDWLQWADILHWYWGMGTFEKQMVKLCNKPGVVQWFGSDIRIPDIDFEINPHYASAFFNGYEYRAIESRENSLNNQRQFADVGFYPLEDSHSTRFIDKGLFPVRFKTTQFIVLSDYDPVFPRADQNRPLLLHSPTAPNAKGTKFVLDAVERLKASYDFEFLLLERMARQEALEVMSHCDIYIDQLIVGSHGYGAVEAMAFGKPVICYINPVAGKDYPRELPIVNADPDNIEEVLANLIQNAARRHELGIKGRLYVEKYHSEEKTIRDLIETYEIVLDLHRGAKA